MTVALILRFFVHIPSEIRERCCCYVKAYKIQCRGAMNIKGVTREGQVVVETDKFLLRRFACKTIRLRNGKRIEVISNGKIQGSVKVTRRLEPDHFTRDDIHLAKYRIWRIKKIFVFTLY